MKILFESERLLFREFSEDDDEVLFDLNNDEEVRIYVHEAPPTLASSQKALQEIILPQYKLYNHGRWALYLKSTNEFIGWCGLKYLRERDEVDLGYRFKKIHWGEGYATEAALAALNYGFKILNLSRISVMAHIDNLPSLRVIEKCGFIFCKEETVDNCLVKTYQLFAHQILSEK